MGYNFLNPGKLTYAHGPPFASESGRLGLTQLVNPVDTQHPEQNIIFDTIKCTGTQSPAQNRAYLVFFLSAIPEPVLRIRIRIHRIHMFLGFPDPDLSIIMQK
jgi:hypothetical protein